MIKDSFGNNYNAATKTDGDVVTITVSMEDIADGTEYIEFDDDMFSASAGSDGYFVIGNVYGLGSYLCRFKQRADEEILLDQAKMPMFGVKTTDKCFMVVAEGMCEGFTLNLILENGKYIIKPRFLTYGKAYADAVLKIYTLDVNSDYSDIARAYRYYQINRGACVPLCERIKNNKELSYAVDSIEIRIRMGWKPAPSPVMEQTVENEPEMLTACTFDRVRDIIDELKNQGIDKAQLCLVGWNKSGHDGRWPQMFPVEEKLGGEEKLISLIQYAKDNGYNIVCHTNSTCAYSISDCWNDDMIAKDKDGENVCSGTCWSGGRSYYMCPKSAYEFAAEQLPKLAKLGFKGIHYVDVITTKSITPCYDKSHGISAKQAVEYYGKIADLCHTLFGGFASEGGNDFLSNSLDYAFYSERVVGNKGLPSKLIDEKIPLWQLVYHGIILSNASTSTVNYTIKDKNQRIFALEYGSRPTFYFYSKFMSNADADWLGIQDLFCGTDEQLKYSVSKIKEAYDEYKKMRFLQTQFMEKHSKLCDGVYECVYQDGTRIIADYNENTIKVI